MLIFLIYQKRLFCLLSCVLYARYSELMPPPALLDAVIALIPSLILLYSL